MTSKVNDAITDSVTHANVKAGNEAPAVAIDSLRGSPATSPENTFANQRMQEMLRKAEAMRPPRD